MTIAILAGLITWLITTIIVDAEITRPIREFFERHGDEAYVNRKYASAMLAWLFEGDRTILDDGPPSRNPLRVLSDKVAYLFGCHLCTGIWVGLLVAVVAPGPFDNVFLDGLAYKGIAHLVLAVVTFANEYSGTVTVNNFTGTEPVADPPGVTPPQWLGRTSDGIRVP
jgi:hypothetical protein